jgi:hypothetical protein
LDALPKNGDLPKSPLAQQAALARFQSKKPTLIRIAGTVGTRILHVHAQSARSEPFK